ncbi:FadR/GntR family transcriptional regulator [Actinomadura sp. SCN-SB]|uniref:FadR/GntR family transcriptional regulator n=1 Tax=Actinomadura sp. SCN-SB TaxID=3373092 RepID=UPI0037533E4A
MTDAGDHLTPVNSGRVSQQIVDQIVALLRSGRLAPHDRLPSERQLAKDFGVSRVTVRDALRILEAQGLMSVKVGAGGGAFVTAPSDQMVGERLNDLLTLAPIDPEDVAEARLVMELGILDLVLARATEQDLEALRAVCERAERSLADGEYDRSTAEQFHARLAEAAHNGAVARMAGSFRGPLRMAALRAREPAADAHQRTVEDHRELVEAIERRDRVTARAVMSRHLTRGTAVEIPEP